MGHICPTAEIENQWRCCWKNIQGLSRDIVLQAEKAAHGAKEEEKRDRIETKTISDFAVSPQNPVANSQIHVLGFLPPPCRSREAMLARHSSCKPSRSGRPQVTLLCQGSPPRPLAPLMCRSGPSISVSWRGLPAELVLRRAMANSPETDPDARIHAPPVHPF